MQVLLSGNWMTDRVNRLPDPCKPRVCLQAKSPCFPQLVSNKITRELSQHLTNLIQLHQIKLWGEWEEVSIWFWTFWLSIPHMKDTDEYLHLGTGPLAGISEQTLWVGIFSSCISIFTIFLLVLVQAFTSLYKHWKFASFQQNQLCPTFDKHFYKNYFCKYIARKNFSRCQCLPLAPPSIVVWS